MSISKQDRSIIWHPFTQEKISDLPIAIKKAKGVYLIDELGNSYLDLISSWWVNLHGHAHPYIAEAIYKQAKKLEHVIFAGFTHEPAVNLCKMLTAMLPSELSRFFFSDNGSTAVEVALKISYQYWWNKGENRTIFVSFEGGYHGDTFGAMSVGKSSGFFMPFQKLFFEVYNIPFPYSWQDDGDVEEKELQSLQILTEYLEKNHKNIVALITEPLIQGAKGMRVCRTKYLTAVVNLVKSYNILVIFDEVMTGFYRTGSAFAFEQIQNIPDVVCLSKGLTGGFMPLALTVTTNDIYEAFLSEDINSAFLHGHSYTANPLSCAAAIASLELLQKIETRNAIVEINMTHRECLNNLVNNYTYIYEPRIIGTIAAFNLRYLDGDNYQKIQILKKKFLDQGLLLRPLGKTIYLLPPYCITIRELKDAYVKIEKIVKDIMEVDK